MIKPVIADCHFNYPTDHGYAKLVQYPHQTVVELHLRNLPTGYHGFHIHEYGDLSRGCDSTGGHYNPFKGTHLNINRRGNHLGDLGNIFVDNDGRCEQIIHVACLPLVGTYSVVDRSMVIHEGIDDLGLGHNEESHKNGNSGKRIACGIIRNLWL